MTSCTESSGCPRHALRSRMRVQIFSHLISFFSPHAILLEEGGCAMALLEKKEILYSVRGNRAEWKKLKKALKDARIRGVSSDVWQDEAPACGCGAHLDIRDFGPNGKILSGLYPLPAGSEPEEPVLRGECRKKAPLGGSLRPCQAALFRCPYVLFLTFPASRQRGRAARQSRTSVSQG